MFGVFIFLSIFPQIVNQIMPVFVSQRTMYEARERPSKAYSWKAFMVANIAVELAWNSVSDNLFSPRANANHGQLMGVLCFICWYFPIGLYKNAEHTDSVDSRGFTTFMHIWVFFLFASTFAHMIIAGIGSADVAGGIVNLFMVMMFTFCG
jgi:ABC-type multidrug transport system permease subunit